MIGIEREAFERWFSDQKGRLSIATEPMPLSDLVKAIAFEGWKAARAQQGRANSCSECGSDDTTWQCLLVPNSGAPTDGRLRLNEVSVVFYRGCNHCSETLETLTEGEIVERLNTQPPTATGGVSMKLVEAIHDLNPFDDMAIAVSLGGDASFATGEGTL